MRRVIPAAAALAVTALAACDEPEPVERATVLPAVAGAESSVAAADSLAAADSSVAAADSSVAAAESSVAAAGSAPSGEPHDRRVTLCVDTARSLVRWRGTKVGGSHEGVVRLAGGRMRLRDRRVRSGRVTADMRTITVTDIPPDQPIPRRRLRDHLAHEEFFSVDRFPTARFVLTGVEATGNGLYSVSGDLAIRDSVHNITFNATTPVVTGDALWASAHFGIDRHLWGIDFDGRTSALRNAIVHDLIQLEVNLVATRDACG